MKQIKLATMEMTLKVYKNEYQPDHTKFIGESFKVVEESERTMTIAGEEAELNKVMSAMFLNDEQFKAIFPEYVTREERIEKASKELESLKEKIATTLCVCIRDGVKDEELFNKYRNFYLYELA